MTLSRRTVLTTLVLLSLSLVLNLVLFIRSTRLATRTLAARDLISQYNTTIIRMHEAQTDATLRLDSALQSARYLRLYGCGQNRLLYQQPLSTQLPTLQDPYLHDPMSAYERRLEILNKERGRPTP